MAGFVIGVGPWLFFLPMFARADSARAVAGVPLTCLASYTAALLLRRQILRPGAALPVGAAFKAVYVTAMFFAWYLALFFAAQYLLTEGLAGPTASECVLSFMGLLVFAPMAATVGATMTLPFTIPFALLGVAVLRKVDPTRTGPTHAQLPISAGAGSDCWAANRANAALPPR
jgi:hypothetical protein